MRLNQSSIAPSAPAEIVAIDQLSACCILKGGRRAALLQHFLLVVAGLLHVPFRHCVQPPSKVSYARNLESVFELWNLGTHLGRKGQEWLQWISRRKVGL